MTPTHNNFGKRWPLMMLLPLMLLLLISMTGCSGRYVVIQGEELVTVKKSTLDNLYRDNEQLLRALGKCQTIKGVHP